MAERNVPYGFGQYQDTNYFKFGRIEIDPGHTRDFIICLGANKAAYRCSFEVRAESDKCGTYLLEPEDNFNVTVIPVDLIPPDQRYQPSFRQMPPFLTHERIKTCNYRDFEIARGAFL